MKIYNHLKKEKELLPKDKTVRIYVCGPTVYNDVHIGNIRPIIIFDVLNRLLLKLGYSVKFVHNITDIDDKIINKAIEENKNELDVSKYYMEQYFEVLKKLGISTNIIFPKISDNIVNIISYINEIIKKDYAYISDGDVYFRTSKINDYGLISGMLIDALEDDSRVSSEKKENKNDFALWKKTDIGIKWKANFSEGRPGWHTECAVLIKKYFGDQADIHGGGVDLKFPHHENENAQNIAINNKNIAKLWMHIGHLNVDNTKMSKSLNNFILAKDILSKYDANAVRWFFYQTSYTNPINFTEELMVNIAQNINYIIHSLNIFKSYCIVNNQKIDSIFDNSYLEILSDDLNLPNTISFINEKVKEANVFLRQNKYQQLSLIYYNLYVLLTEILGIKIINIHTYKNIEILLEWNKLKNEKKFSEADKKRKILIEKKLI